MKDNLLFAFLTILILTLTNCCDSSVSTLGCQFYVQSTSQDCTAFNLQFCEWTVCDYYITDSNNSTYCGHYSTQTSSSWGKCMSTCCHNNDAPQTYDTLQQCYDDNKKIAIIIGSVVGGVAALVIIICVICRLRNGSFRQICSCIGNCCSAIGDCFKACFRCCRNPFRHQQSGLEVHIMNQTPQPQMQFQMVKDYWMDCEPFNNGDENCAICLDNAACVRLECRHIYHKHCILDWIAKRAHCPLCNNQVTKITLFCKKCMKKKREMSLQITRSKLNTYGQCCESCT